MAEALETTVLEEDKEVAQDLLNIQSPPNILQANNQGEDDDEFQEMNPKVEEEFCEMLSTKKDDADEEQEDDDEEEVFKIKEEAEEAPEESKVDLMEVEEDDENQSRHHHNSALDLLGNDIVKSIEKANLLYEGSNNSNTGSGSVMFKNNESSEDDLEFKPVTSGKKKKKNKNKSNSSSLETGSGTSSCLDSSAEESACDTKTSTNEGWSFEADDLDVNKLLAEVVSQQQQQQPQEEKAALEDVFKFDSELNNDSKEKKIIDMSSSLNYEDDSKEDTKMSQSLTYGGCSTTTTSNSESSVGNSPNPRAASKKKGKSKKKKR